MLGGLRESICMLFCWTIIVGGLSQMRFGWWLTEVDRVAETHICVSYGCWDNYRTACQRMAPYLQ